MKGDQLVGAENWDRVLICEPVARECVLPEKPEVGVETISMSQILPISVRNRIGLHCIRAGEETGTTFCPARAGGGDVGDRTGTGRETTFIGARTA